jgi:DNA-binding IclR family transcriptional regulator
MTPLLRAALAYSVAALEDETALLIDKNNDCVGMSDIQTAATNDSVFAIKPAASLLAVDVDGGADNEIVDGLIKNLRSHGLDPVVLESGRPGNRHVFCFVTDLSLFEESVKTAKRAKADVRSASRIRPPGTKHRSGVAPRLLSHATWYEALESLDNSRPSDEFMREFALRLSQSRELASDATNEEPHTEVEAGVSKNASKRMNSSLYRLVRYGDECNKYLDKTGEPDDSRLLMSICSRAVLQDYPKEALWNQLVLKQNKGGASLHKRIDKYRTQDAARNLFELTFKKAKETSRRQRRSVMSREEALQVIETIERVGRAAQWPGRNGSYTRAVFAAACQIARQFSSITPCLAARPLAEESGVSLRTVRLHVSLLVEQGWLVQKGPWRESRGRCYELCIPQHILEKANPELLDNSPFQKLNTTSKSTCATSYPLLVSSGGRGSVASLRSIGRAFSPALDAFAHKGLGKGPWRALEAVTAGASSSNEVASQVGCHPATARRNVAALIDAGLLLRDKGVLELVHVDLGESELESLAERLGTAGTASARVERHMRERNGYRAFCVRRRAARQTIPLSNATTWASARPFLAGSTPAHIKSAVTAPPKPHRRT